MTDELPHLPTLRDGVRSEIAELGSDLDANAAEVIAKLRELRGNLTGGADSIRADLADFRDAEARRFDETMGMLEEISRRL